MVRIVGIHRTNHTQIIRKLGREGQEFTDFQSALAMVTVLKRNGHQRSGGTLGSQIGTLRFLTRKLVQRRLGIKQIALKRPTVHEQVNNPLDFGLKMRLHPQIRWRTSRFLSEQISQGKHSESSPCRLQRLTPRIDGSIRLHT